MSAASLCLLHCSMAGHSTGSVLQQPQDGREHSDNRDRAEGEPEENSDPRKGLWLQEELLETLV